MTRRFPTPWTVRRGEGSYWVEDATGHRFAYCYFVRVTFTGTGTEHQEWGLRPGTLPVPLIAGFGLAAELAEREKEERRARCLNVREQAIQAFSKLDARLHCDPRRGVLANILSLAVPGLDSEAVMVAVKGLVAISNGSACTSASYQASHVLNAMGLEPDVVSGTIRMSWSHMTPEVPWKELVSALDDVRF
jgi:cysteine desulfurase